MTPREITKPVKVSGEDIRRAREGQVTECEETDCDASGIGAHAASKSIATDPNLVHLIGRTHIEAAVAELKEPPASAGIRAGELGHEVVYVSLYRKHVPTEVPGKRLDSGVLGNQACLDAHLRETASDPVNRAAAFLLDSRRN